MAGSLLGLVIIGVSLRSQKKNIVNVKYDLDRHVETIYFLTAVY